MKGSRTRSKQTEPARPRRTGRVFAALAITAVYMAVVGVVASHHELWRDEVRALNIAAGARSPLGLFALLHNEGHPPLWYLLLYIGHALTHSMMVLKPISIACAAGAAFLLLRYAPFPLWQKVLFLGGAFPLYEYSVICRNYGIGMLLMFAVAALHRERFRRPIPFCVALALLANTSAYALLIAATILAAVIGEAIVTRPPADRRLLMRAGVGVLIVVAGMAIAASVGRPDATSTVTAAQAHSSLGSALLHVGDLLDVLAPGYRALAHVLFWAIAAYFLTRPWLLATWMVVGFAFSAFSALVYPANPFQHGLLYILLIVLLWIDRDLGGAPRLPERFAMLARPVAVARDGVFVILLVSQVFLGVRLARKDLTAQLSSSESFGRFLTGSRAYRDAIVISEPAVLVEALPYYAPNRIFLPREGKDMIKVDFTIAAKRSLSLDELLKVADRLKSETGHKVLVVTNHPLNPAGPFAIRYPYGLEFVYAPDSLERFASRAEEVAVFDRAVSDENYAVYEIH